MKGKLILHTLVAAIGGFYGVISLSVTIILNYLVDKVGHTSLLLAKIFTNNMSYRRVTIGSFSDWMFSGSITFLFAILVIALKEGKGIEYSFSVFPIMTFVQFFFFKIFLFDATILTWEEIELRNKENKIIYVPPV